LLYVLHIATKKITGISFFRLCLQDSGTDNPYQLCSLIASPPALYTWKAAGRGEGLNHPSTLRRGMVSWLILHGDRQYCVSAFKMILSPIDLSLSNTIYLSQSRREWRIIHPISHVLLFSSACPVLSCPNLVLRRRRDAWRSRIPHADIRYMQQSTFNRHSSPFSCLFLINLGIPNTILMLSMSLAGASLLHP